MAGFARGAPVLPENGERPVLPEERPVLPENGERPVLPEKGWFCARSAGFARAAPVLPENGERPVLPENGEQPVLPEKGRFCPRRAGFAREGGNIVCGRWFRRVWAYICGGLGWRVCGRRLVTGIVLVRETTFTVVRGLGRAFLCLSVCLVVPPLPPKFAELRVV